MTVMIEHLDELSTRTASVENGVADAAAAAAALAQRVAALESRPQGSVAPSSFSSRTASSTGSMQGRMARDDFAFDSGIVRISARIPVARLAIERALEDSVRGGAEGSLRVLGPEHARRFVVKPVGAQGAESWAQGLLDSRRTPDGGWAQLYVTSPGGQSVEVFLDRDRSYASRKQGFHTSKLAAALRQTHPSLAVTAQRSTGSLLVAWQEVVQVRCSSETRQAMLHWDSAAALAVGVDTAATMPAYQAAVGAAGPERAGPRAFDRCEFRSRARTLLAGLGRVRRAALSAEAAAQAARADGERVEDERGVDPGNSRHDSDEGVELSANALDAPAPRLDRPYNEEVQGSRGRRPRPRGGVRRRGRRSTTSSGWADIASVRCASVRMPPEGFSVASWNGRAVLHTDPVKARKKWRVVSMLMVDNDALFLQETHGDSHDAFLTRDRVA